MGGGRRLANENEGSYFGGRRISEGHRGRTPFHAWGLEQDTPAAVVHVCRPLTCGVPWVVSTFAAAPSAAGVVATTSEGAVPPEGSQLCRNSGSRHRRCAG